MINTLFIVGAVALIFALLYYRSRALSAEATGVAKDEKIARADQEFAEAQKEDRLEDVKEASEVKSGGGIGFLRNSFRRNRP